MRISDTKWPFVSQSDQHVGSVSAFYFYFVYDVNEDLGVMGLLSVYEAVFNNEAVE